MKEKEDAAMSNLYFRLMALTLKIRDIFSPPEKILEESGIQQGFQVLDFGCGPGSFTLAAARIIGESGKVYALDIHPLAVQTVQKKATKKKLPNIETISSGCATGQPEQSIDVVILNDVFHEFKEPDNVLKELSRILKPNGILLFSDHHLREEQILSGLTQDGFFRLLRKGKKNYIFRKI